VTFDVHEFFTFPFLCVLWQMFIEHYRNNTDFQ
jgi:hypothetical protein